MSNSVVRRLSIVGLSLVLTTGLLVGCSSGDTDSSAQSADQEVAKQSESNHQEHEHGHDEAKSEDDGHHEEDGHEHDHERADHFEGKKAESYDEAVSNMKTANARLEKLLNKDELANEDFFKIHRMSYTMENALKVIREKSDGKYEDVKKNLESVHLASEKGDAETVRQDGRDYLEGAKAMLDGE